MSRILDLNTRNIDVYWEIYGRFAFWPDRVTRSPNSTPLGDYKVARHLVENMIVPLCRQSETVQDLLAVHGVRWGGQRHLSGRNLGVRVFSLGIDQALMTEHQRFVASYQDLPATASEAEVESAIEYLDRMLLCLGGQLQLLGNTCHMWKLEEAKARKRKQDHARWQS
ncbi:hypothetical protein [Sciscionella marina]|uniref:hypothetical protein n=1 Tax=Sciscionella marina TaxID=508770 RepID=UPI00038071E2|nr:hypothetical protein [Sciscionella marina]